jgi:DHA2 family multidrug resistance protein
VLAEHVAIGDPITTERVNALTRAFVARGADAWTAHQRALAMIDREIIGQANVLAYSRIYVLSALLILLLIPLLALVRQTSSVAGGASHAIME